MSRTQFQVAWILTGLLTLTGVGAAGPAPAESESAAQTRLGRDAAKAGKSHVARHHFLNALASEPACLPAWAELAALDASDADAKALWALGAGFAVTDARGKPTKFPFGPPFPNAEVAVPLDLAAKRAAWARSVAEAADKQAVGASGAVLRWLRLVAGEAACGAAALGAPAIASTEKALERCRPDTSKVRAALEAALVQAKAAGDFERALEAARFLVGLSAQRRGVLGPKAPIAEGFGARHAVAEAREAIRAKAPAPIPFEELSKLAASPGKLTFEDAHATWANPIVATSREKRYRIESVCGLETTVEAADQIERCHDRLVAWCGKDPFPGRPGLVRLCPSYAELECEGQPHWWAVGFASGDVLTVVVEWSTGDDLSRLLAHELTHRFDAAMRPGLPAWVMEGRANYVGATTTYARCLALDEASVDFGQIDEAAKLVGGDLAAFTDLLTGRDPEYRHNYPVGYAFWTFLSQWTGPKKGPWNGAGGDRAPYRERIPAMLAALQAAPGGVPQALEKTLCDGKDGRAGSFQELGAQFFGLLFGLWGAERPAWVKAWMDRLTAGGGEKGWDYDLRDRSNHARLRRRLDPPAEGEGVAALAATWFEKVGSPKEALDAHALADASDEFDAPRYARALALEVAAGRKDAAFARARLLQRVRPGAAEPARPDAGVVSTVLTVGGTYLDALAKACTDATAASRPRTARALRAEHDRVATLLGRAPLGESGVEAPPALGTAERHGVPDCPPAVDPLVGGVVEERWSAQDGTVGGLYAQPAPGEIVLGRKRSTAAETGEDRRAEVVNVAVRTRDAFQGTYSVRLHVRFETSYVAGRVILGWTRRDRGVELRFRAGDRAYGEGTSGVNEGRARVDLSLSDLREIDERVTALRRPAPIGDSGGEGAGFDLVFHVSGPYVRAQVDGRDVFSLRRVTGEPIEGYLGFAVDSGRALFSRARVESHRVLGPDATCRCDRFDAPLDPAVPGTFSWTSVVGRRVRGLAPSKNVRLLLWGTGLSAADPTGASTIHEALKPCREAFVASGYPLDVHVAVRGEPNPGGSLEAPASFPQSGGLKIPDDHLHLHHGFPGLDVEAETLPQTYELGWPGWGGLFIDPEGIVRVRGPIDDLHRGIRLARYLAGR